jgi:pyruvate dehydrogenase E2 component (dihydrolipoamide acetyltransferase)
VYDVPSCAVTDTHAPSATENEPLAWRRRKPRDTRGFLSPAVRHAAAERDVDATQLSGSGADGRVTRADVLVVGTTTRGDDVVPLNNVRRRGAKALLASKRTAPHALAVVAADYTAVERVRSEAGLTALPFVARAVIDTLRVFPMLNATVDGDSLVMHRVVNLGVAVDLDFQGLVVPVIRGSDGMRLRSLANAIRDVAARARSKQLGPDDLAGGTFTITNPGAAGTWMSFPVLNAPQVAILSTDGVAKRVVVDTDGGLRIAPVGHLCLTFDHRALDGAYVGAFLARLRETIERRDWTPEILG